MELLLHSRTAQVSILQNPEALASIKADLTRANHVRLYCYLVDEIFFSSLFGPLLRVSGLDMLCDARQPTILRHLVENFPRLRARTWSSNRTMHSKMLLLSPCGVVYSGSHNYTKGSFSLATNHTARVDCKQLADELAHEFDLLFARGTRITPTKEAPA